MCTEESSVLYLKKDYDDKLIESNFKLGDREYYNYKRHTGYLPYVGDKYGFKHPKILLVFESHYLHPDDRESINDNLEKKVSEVSKRNELFINSWYFDDIYNFDEHNHLIRYKNFYNTRNVAADVIYLNRNNNRVLLDPLRVFNNLFNKTVGESSYSIEERHTLRNFAYMNFYQRPEIHTGKSINRNGLDDEIAFRNIINVVKILNPDKVVFISIKSFKVFKSLCTDLFNDSIETICVCQPGNKYWNKHQFDKKYLSSKLNEWY